MSDLVGSFDKINLGELKKVRPFQNDNLLLKMIKVCK